MKGGLDVLSDRLNWIAAALLLATVWTSAAETVPKPPPPSKMTDEYVRLVGRNAYFWAWPMVNLFNRRVAFKDLKEPGLVGGIVPSAPPNHNCMLTDYIAPGERAVACPNQDVVYGIGVLALDRSPVVVQVPDFGDRFWVYQVVDLRTDSFAGLGKMYGTRPGFYLLAGPDWKGEMPPGIEEVFRSSTRTGVILPRVFRSDTPEDLAAVQGVLRQILIYPLSEFDGKMKSRDWNRVATLPAHSEGQRETQWVFPEKFFDELPAVLEDAPPRPGEEALYAQVKAVLAAAAQDRHLMEVLAQAAADADKDLVRPLFEFRNYGVQLPERWSTIRNGAAFGMDYFTRTAVAQSNIFVNKPEETSYFYQDLDRDGTRLNGANRYTVTFPKGGLPPVEGFWSLTLYNEHHFFAPNELGRYSLGTKSAGLKYGADGSLTLHVQAEPPTEELRANWLPAPAGDFSLYIRAYWPEDAIVGGAWTPPPVMRTTR